jgi:hypothetical protein
VPLDDPQVTCFAVTVRKEGRRTAVDFLTRKRAAWPKRTATRLAIPLHK